MCAWNFTKMTNKERNHKQTVNASNYLDIFEMVTS